MIFQAEWHLFLSRPISIQGVDVSGEGFGEMDVRAAASDVSGAMVVLPSALFFSVSCGGYAQCSF